jgi:hypothetical protein
VFAIGHGDFTSNDQDAWLKKISLATFLISISFSSFVSIQFL